MSLTPVALFVYNRPDHTKKTVEALLNNFEAAETELFIFSDGPKNLESEKGVKLVRDFIKSVSGFKRIEVIERDLNLGLSGSIISGVSSVLNDFDTVIVLEDDLISSKNFLSYMNSALDFYKENRAVFSAAGYSPPITINENYKYDSYLIPTRSASWGWGTWKNVWEKIDWEIKDFYVFKNHQNKTAGFDLMGKDMTRMLESQLNGDINSWSIRFDYHLFKNNAYCAYPVRSKIQNAGMDATGTHSDATDEYFVELDNSDKTVFKFAADPDETLIKTSQKFYNDRLNFVNKFKRKINSFRKK